VIISNARFNQFFDGIRFDGIGWRNTPNQELVSEDDTTQTWRYFPEVFRRDSGEVSRDYILNAFLNTGTMLRWEGTVALDGGAKADTEGPTLIKSEHSFDGKPGNTLNLHALAGRQARIQAFACYNIGVGTALDLDTIRMFLDNPVITRGTDFAWTGGINMKVDGNEETYQSNLSVFNNIKWGKVTPDTELAIKVYAADVWGNEMCETIAMPKLIVPQDGDDPGDDSSPELRSSVINNGVTFEVQPELELNLIPHISSGLDIGLGISSLNLVYKHSMSDHRFFINADRFNQVGTEGGANTYVSDSFINKWAGSGSYLFESATVRDLIGNFRSYSMDDDDLPEGLQSTVEINNPNEDIINPVLGLVLFDPDAGVDVSESPGMGTLKITATDVGSGIQSGQIQVGILNNFEYQYKFLFFGPADLVNAETGEYHVTVNFDMGEMPGERQIEINLRDMAGNGLRYGANLSGFGEVEPFAEGSISSITVLNPSYVAPTDRTVPMLLSISIDDNGWDWKDGAAALRVAMEILEEESGLKDPGFGFGFSPNKISVTSPTGINVSSWNISESDRVAGTNRFEFDVMIPQAVESGNHFVTVNLEDNESNRVTYGLARRQMPFPGGFNGYQPITNSGLIDYSAPMVENLNVTPTTAGAGDAVTVDIEFDISEIMGVGFSSGLLRLQNGTDTQFGFRNTIWSTNFLPPDVDSSGTGTKLEANYKWTVPILEGITSGDFLSLYAEFNDEAGNQRIYNSQFFDAGFFAGPFPRKHARVGLVNFATELDYDTFAELPDTFPENTLVMEKAFAFDFDFDGYSNGREWIFGSNLADNSDFPQSWVTFEEGVGTTLHFRPFFENRLYTLVEGLPGRIQVESTKIPLLGDLPGVGTFFLSQENSPERKELLILIRPTVVF
jgi:hypothetical protein